MFLVLIVEELLLCLSCVINAHITRSERVNMECVDFLSVRIVKLAKLQF